VLDPLQLRAQPAIVTTTSQVTASNSTSITRYGRRSWQEDVPWCSAADAAAVAQAIINNRATRTPTVVLQIRSGGRGSVYDTRLTQQLARDLSDRVTVIEAQTGLNRDGHIERVEHDIDWDAQTHDTRFYIDTSVPTTATLFIINGSSGQRFNEGVFAL
jgi:hypothetical protein